MMVTMPDNISYDAEQGELSFIGEHVRQVIKVRQQIEDKALVQAVIIELERLGYTVISPEGKLLT
jgi:hypothetical protein